MRVTRLSGCLYIDRSAAPDSTVSTSIGWIAMKFCTHGPVDQSSSISFFFFFHQQQVKVSIFSSFSPPGQSNQLQLWPTLCFCVHGTHYVHQDVNITSMNNASMLAVAVNSKHQCAYPANIYSTCNQQTSSHKVKTDVGES